MTPQVKYRAKASPHRKRKAPRQSDRVKRMFQSHPAYGRVFAPWGRFGATYAVPTEAEYRQLVAEFSAVEQKSGVFFVVLMAPLYFDFIPLSLVEKGLAIVGLSVCYHLVYAAKVKRATRCLALVEPRPPIWLALQRSAHTQESRGLWWVSVLCSLISGALWGTAQVFHGEEQLGLWAAAFLFASFALLSSLMLVLHVLPLPKKA